MNDENPEVEALAEPKAAPLKFTKDTSITELNMGALTTMFQVLTDAIVVAIGKQFGAQWGAEMSQQMAGQISNQIEKTISQVAGSNVSDTVSRLISEGIIKSDVDIGMHERIRATGARGDAAFAFKTNAVDFLSALNGVSHQGQGQRYIDQMTQTALTHFGESLKDERIRKSEMNYFNNAKITQEQYQKDAVGEQTSAMDVKILEALNKG